MQVVDVAVRPRAGGGNSRCGNRSRRILVHTRDPEMLCRRLNRCRIRSSTSSTSKTWRPLEDLGDGRLLGYPAQFAPLGPRLGKG